MIDASNLLVLRVFIDANVLFSASKTGSNISRLLKLLLEQGNAITSDFAVEEARRNIELKRPGWEAEFSTLVQAVEIVPSVQFPLPVTIVGKDQTILCTATRSGCNALVTGDRQHFGHLYDQTIQGVLVVTLLRLAEMLTDATEEGF